MVCCDSLEVALDSGFVLLDEEYMLPQRALTDINPDAKVGNVLTGETGDPSEWSLAMAISFCPFCGQPLEPPRRPVDEFDPFVLEDLCDSDD